MTKQRFFFVDAETDGLYGRFLSVAALVTDAAGVEVDRFYGAAPVPEEQLRSPWVRDHVAPFLSNAAMTFREEGSLLEAFWDFWMKHRETALCVAYVPYPVESRLFLQCVMAAPEEREFLAPFPLYDLATLLADRRMDFDADLQSLSGLDLPSHDPFCDARMTAAVWFRLTR